MLYCIEGKFYILASNKYREVEVVKKGNEISVNVVQDGNIIENTSMQAYPKISLEDAYKSLEKNFKK